MTPAYFKVKSLVSREDAGRPAPWSDVSPRPGRLDPSADGKVSGKPGHGEGVVRPVGDGM